MMRLKLLKGALALFAFLAAVGIVANRAEADPLPLETGDIVVADGYGGLARVPAGGGTAEVLVSDPAFSMVEDVAIDAAGNLIVADIGNNTIFRVSCEDGSVETVATLSGPDTSSVHDVAVDANGDYIVLVHYDTALFRVTPDGTVTLITTIPGASETEGLDIDSSGNFIIADEFPSSNPPPGLLYRVSPDGSSITTLGDDSATSDGPEAVIVDTNGEYIVIDETDPALYRVSTDGLTITQIYAGSPAPFSSDGPQGIALAPNGDFLVADQGDRIVQVARDGSSATTISSGPPLTGPRDLTVYTRCGLPPEPTPTPTVTPTGTPPATPTATPEMPQPSPSATVAAVVALPETGAGSDGSGGAPGWLTAVLAGAGVAAAAGYGALRLRARRA